MISSLCRWLYRASYLSILLYDGLHVARVVKLAILWHGWIDARRRYKSIVSEEEEAWWAEISMTLQNETRFNSSAMLRTYDKMWKNVWLRLRHNAGRFMSSRTINSCFMKKFMTIISVTNLRKNFNLKYTGKSEINYYDVKSTINL